MSQQDCLDWLREQKNIDDNKWHKIKDIQAGLKEKGLGNGTVRNAWSHVMKLCASGDLEFRGVGLWDHHKEFKLK